MNKWFRRLFGALIGCALVCGAHAEDGGNTSGGFSNFIAGFTPSSPGAIANLFANAPCASGNLAQLAVVSDYLGNTNENMRCTASGTLFYWQPVRANYSTTMTIAGGTTTMTITPFVTAPTLVLSGTLTTPLIINLSTTNAYPGEVENISTSAVVPGLNTITLTGLISGLTKLIGLSGYQAVYSCTTASTPVCAWQVFP